MVSVSEATIQNVQGSASLFNTAASGSSTVTIDKLTLKDCQGTSTSNSLDIVNGGTVSITNSQIKNLQNYEISFVEGDTVTLEYVEVEDVQGVVKLVNALD